MLVILIALLLGGCAESLSFEPPVFTPALPQKATPTPQQLTILDICGFVSQPQLSLGKTNEDSGIKWLSEHTMEVKPSDKIDGLYYVHFSDESFSIFFFDDILLAGDRSFQQSDWSIEDIVSSFGNPDKVYGRSMWIFGCEGEECSYIIELIYVQKGFIVTTSGTSRNPVWFEDGNAGVILDPHMKIERILCFVPGELETYLAHAFTQPIQLKEEHLHEWQGFGMVVPMQ